VEIEQGKEELHRLSSESSEPPQAASKEEREAEKRRASRTNRIPLPAAGPFRKG
jgi:hypothetical protein